MKQIVLAVALVLGLAACGPDPSQTGAPDRDASSVASSALDFSAETVDGASFDASALKGKDAVLWFWAPWCTQCAREAPQVAKAQAANADVEFVGVAGLGQVDAMRAFVDDYDVGAFKHLNDTDGSLWKRFEVARQPAYAFIDDDGTIEVVRGELGADGIATRVAALAGA